MEVFATPLLLASRLNGRGASNKLIKLMISLQHDLGNLLDAKRPLVVLKKHAFQEGFGPLPGRWLYNVISGDYAHGSTVTIESMKMRGFRVEVVS